MLAGGLQGQSLLGGLFFLRDPTGRFSRGCFFRTEEVAKFSYFGIYKFWKFESTAIYVTPVLFSLEIVSILSAGHSGSFL